MNPLISIVIPTYNSEKYLKECFDSIVSQTYDNLEVLIIDGESSDNTQTITSKYCNKYNNWKLLITNKGVSHQRNVGLDNFKGDYLFFLDSDDFISSNLIKDLYNMLINNNLDIANPLTHDKYYKDGILIETKISEINVIQNVNPNNFFSEAYNSDLGSPIKLYRRELVNNLRHDETISNGEDLLFNYQIVKNKTINYDVCKDAIYYYRHDVSLVNSANKRLNKSGYLFCNKMVDILENMKKKDKNFYGALSILNTQLLLFMKAYVSKRKIIPHSLRRARIYMFKNTKRRFRYYYLFPRLFNIVNALIH